MTFYHDTPQNIQHLVDKIPGMLGPVARAWLRCEGQAVNNPSNPLNILYYGRRDRGQIAQQGRFAVYASPERGLQDAANLIMHSAYYEGVRHALRTRHPLTIARAIEDSPWAGGHYGGGGSRDGCIVRGLGTLPPIVKPPVKPKPPKPVEGKKFKYRVKKGDTLSGIAARFLGNANRWREIYNLNKKKIGQDPNLIKIGWILWIPEK